MSHPSRLLLAALVWCGAALPAPPALAQSEADVAYQDAKKAFAAEDFAQARDLLIKASQTAPRNPDIWVLLGDAHLRLGELDEALAAWQRTLVLAPEQAYAKRMVAALQGRRLEAARAARGCWRA